MSDLELRRLAHFIVLEMASNENLIVAMAKAQKKVMKKETRLVSAKEAARIIGISVWQLYHIKDDKAGLPRFSYIKCGKGKSGTLKFNAITLVDEYARYVASLKGEN